MGIECRSGVVLGGDVTRASVGTASQEGRHGSVQ